MPDPRRLDLLTQLRKDVGVTLAEMARACGLTGQRAYESASAWERGISVPQARLRFRFLQYLAFTLDLYQNRPRLQHIWQVLVEEWGWDELVPADWQALEALSPPDAATPPGQRRAATAIRQPAPAPLPPGSVMPFSANPHFVGREQELQVLARLLRRRGTVVLAPRAQASLSGLGGIGKTQLAIEFVHRYGRFFPGGVFWISFADPEAVPAMIAACGGKAGMHLRPDFAQLSLDAQVRLVQGAWQSAVLRLLVFDNCEESDLLRRWLPTQGGCRVLITSRRRTWESDLEITTLPLSLLPRRDSLALLRQYCPTPQIRDEVLIAIAAELDDLPLALHLAGSYIARSADSASPEHYLTALRRSLMVGEPDAEHHASLLGRGPRGRALPTPTGHANHLDLTFAVSLARLDLHDPIDALAYGVLFRAAWFAPGELILRDQLFATVNAPPDQARMALHRLHDLGFVFFSDATGHTLRLHRLLVAFLRRHDPTNEAWQAVEHAVLQHVRMLNDRLDQPALLGMQVHLRAITDTALQRGDAVAAALSYELSRHLGQIEQYAEATVYNQRSLELRAQIFGSDAAILAENMHQAGELLDWQGDYPGARPYHEHGLTLRLNHYGVDHPETVTSFMHVGEIAHALCDYATARSHYTQVLAIRIHQFGADSPEAAGMHNNLGLLLNATGALQDALPHAERAVAIWEEQPEPNHSLQAISLNNLGYLRRTRGEYPVAIPIFERALVIREAIYGPANTYVGVTRNHLGRVYHYLGDLEQAQQELNRAFTIFMDALGLEHPITASTLSNLGMLALEQGNMTTAQAQLEQALEIHRRLCGADHRHTARSLNRLGLFHYHQHEFRMAYRYFRAALQIRRHILGEQHHDTANTLSHLGMLRLMQGNVRQAQPLLAEALRVHQHNLGLMHPYTARSLLRMGQVLRANGEQAGATAYLRQALMVYTTVFGFAHPYTVHARTTYETSR